MSYGSMAHKHKNLPVKLYTVEIDGDIRTYKTLGMARNFLAQKVNGRKRWNESCARYGRPLLPEIEGKIWESDPIAWNEVH